MAEGILFGIAQEILKNLGSRALEETALAWGFKDRLDNLTITINTIKDELLDAEQRQLDTHAHAVRGWLERLAADDLFDEVATTASRKQTMGGSNKLDKEVSTFFSSSNQVVFAFSISRKIKCIRERLDDIVKDSIEFAFVHRPGEEGGLGNTVRGRGQTYSYVEADEVIGRDDDKKAVLDELLASCGESDGNEEVLSVVPIVGIGGQGKTALAQLVYNDPQVDKWFESKMWVCVSDVFDIKVLTEKILKASASSNIEKGLEMEQLQGLLRSNLTHKRYLLVLDDVWNEAREEWLKLVTLLKVGKKGSKILVTTRSKKTAKIMGTIRLYELQGLLEEQSWDLFQKMAFEPGTAKLQPQLVKIGKEIVKKCANVPLAIRSLGSLLYGQSESKWLAYKDTSLAHIHENQCDVMSILKLSYKDLWSPLKNCFTYCALFPKDYEFDKETLIALWMAEGFIVIPTGSESQSLEQVGEDYYVTLVQKCFFQDIEKDEWGAIRSCKMHDLIHDLAQNVAGFKCKAAKVGDMNFDNRIRHLSFDYRLNSQWKILSSMLNLKPLRTFLLPIQDKDGSYFSKSMCHQLISTFSCLRVLDLHELGIQSLPNSVGKLIHLRYLDLSGTWIEELPESTTKLQNLQTLELHSCSKLKRLPKNIRALTNLRSLNVSKCPLTYMPNGIGELTCLHKLPRFMVKPLKGHRGKPKTATFSDLKNLGHLSGVLCIDIIRQNEDRILDAEEADISGKQGLTEFMVEFQENYDNIIDGSDHDEAVLEGLRPHPNLRKLKVLKYDDHKLPSWLMMNNLRINLPNLVEIELHKFERCQQVPSFGRLPYLKRLTLQYMTRVEYMETESSMYDGLASLSELAMTETPVFFPSLEYLLLVKMDELKGWWKEVGETVNDSDVDTAADESGKRRSLLLSMSFPKLSHLTILLCPNIEHMPLCPNVEAFAVMGDTTNVTLSLSRMAVSPSKLISLGITDVQEVISLPKECLNQLVSLKIRNDVLLSTDTRLGEVFRSLPSLVHLCFIDCVSLTYVDRGLGDLPELEQLEFVNCEQLDVLINEDDELPWKNIKSLLHLVFHRMPKLVGLPRGLHHLSQLRLLKLQICLQLVELPEWISCLSCLEILILIKCPKLTHLPEGLTKLTALCKLEIRNCPGLTEICRPPYGTEWHKIKHIPCVSISHDD